MPTTEFCIKTPPYILHRLHKVCPVLLVHYVNFVSTTCALETGKLRLEGEMNRTKKYLLHEEQI